ncbi:MAG: IS200/IS605 family element transposase accessory protein TnpB [Proteocatella sp.]|nr:IS200/IS605 family element transposase accessory protein TnpB [Proteocatella sp.]
MLLVHKAYKFRIYPDSNQALLIVKTIGCSRFVFNHFLAERSSAYESEKRTLSYSNCSAMLTQLKKELTWLKEVDSTALQSSLRFLDDSFKRFFSRQNDYPRFKSRKNPVQSYTSKFTNNNIAVEDSFIKLPKLGLVRFSKSREVDGRIISATVSRKPSGKFFVSLLAETEVSELPKTEIACGVDVGLKDFAVLSDGSGHTNPRFFRSLEAKLAKEQRILSRRVKYSSNWYKQKLKVARVHEKIANTRADYLHKLSTDIVKNHDIIGMEDLQVSDMLKNKRLSKAISEVSWSQFKELLEYKAVWYGKKVITVSKTFASSQLCSACNYQNKAVKNLSVRTWTCPSCNAVHDRDINASINLRNEAIRLLTAGTAGLA